MKTDMKHINSLAAAVFLAAVLSSCAKMRVETEEIRPTGTPIRMAVSSEGAQTKALFDAASFSAVGNVLQIWDVYFNSVVAPQAYIEGTNVVSTGTTGAVWPFKEGDAVSSPDKHYYWTKTGTHRFYGVLVKDNSGSAPLTPTTGWGFDAAHKVYSVPTTTLTLTSPQFDFVYSNVIERNLDNGARTTAVPLKFNHLFSAFSFTFENDSPSSFNIKSATLKVANQAAATIDYSNVWDKNFAPADAENWNPAVTYSDLAMSPDAGISGKTGEIQAGTCYDMFQGGELTDMSNYDKYTLIWPQDLTGKTLVMSYLVSGKKYQEVDVTVNKYTYTTTNGTNNYDVRFTNNLNYVTPTGDKSFDYNYENGHYVYVGRGKGNYAVRSAYKWSSGEYTRSTITDKESQIVDYTEEKTVTKNLKDITPGGTWLAGNRYLYKLVFSDNEVNLVVSVMKWEDGHGGNVTFQ